MYAPITIKTQANLNWERTPSYRAPATTRHALRKGTFPSANRSASERLCGRKPLASRGSRRSRSSGCWWLSPCSPRSTASKRTLRRDAALRALTRWSCGSRCPDLCGKKSSYGVYGLRGVNGLYCQMSEFYRIK